MARTWMRDLPGKGKVTMGMVASRRCPSLERTIDSDTVTGTLLLEVLLPPSVGVTLTLRQGGARTEAWGVLTKPH